MNKKLTILPVLLSLFVLSSTHIAFAEECNTVLKETDSYQELSIILNCLSNKIENLEKEAKKPRPSGTQSTENDRPAALLDNKFITVFDLNLSRKDNNILVSFIIKSKYDKDIFISILSGSPIVTDESGDSTNQYDVKGLSQANKSTPEQGYTVLNPGVPTPVSIKFYADKIKGNEFSLRVGLLHLFNDKAVDYSFGITKIILNNK